MKQLSIFDVEPNRCKCGRTPKAYLFNQFSIFWPNNKMWSVICDCGRIGTGSYYTRNQAVRQWNTKEITAENLKSFKDHPSQFAFLNRWRRGDYLENY